jgi:hypothetical protein
MSESIGASLPRQTKHTIASFIARANGEPKLVSTKPGRQCPASLLTRQPHPVHCVSGHITAAPSRSFADDF